MILLFTVISVLDHPLMKNHLSTNCANCWSCSASPLPFTKFLNGRKTKSSSSTATCWNNLPRIRRQMNQSRMKTLIVPDCICNGKPNYIYIFTYSKEFYLNAFKLISEWIKLFANAQIKRPLPLSIWHLRHGSIRRTSSRPALDTWNF